MIFPPSSFSHVSPVTFGRLPSFSCRIVFPLSCQGDCVLARPGFYSSFLCLRLIMNYDGYNSDDDHHDDDADGDDGDDLPSIRSATTPSLATARTETQRALS